MSSAGAPNHEKNGGSDADDVASDATDSAVPPGSAHEDRDVQARSDDVKRGKQRVGGSEALESVPPAPDEESDKSVTAGTNVQRNGDVGGERAGAHRVNERDESDRARDDEGRDDGDADAADDDDDNDGDEDNDADLRPSYPPGLAGFRARAADFIAEWRRPLPSIARSTALAALLGLAAVLWFRFNFKARWVTDLLIENKLDPAERSRLIFQMALALGAGGLAGFVSAVRAHRRGDSVREVESWLWFVSPLIVFPSVPLLLRFRPWVDRLDALLPVVLLCALVLEALVFRAVKYAPDSVRDQLNDALAKLPEKARRIGPFAIVAAAAVAYGVFFSFYMVRWHYKLKTGIFDLGINNNLMFGGLHGRFLESPVLFPLDPPKYLANHAKFGGYLFLPIYALFPRPETLQIIQSVLLGLGALPLFGFARKRLGDGMALVVALAYLCYYPMHAANFNEVNHIPIAAPFILATVWALDAKRWVWFGVFCVAGTLMREDIPIGMAVIGTFLLLSGYRPWLGLGLAVVSSAWFVYLRFYVMDSAGSWWFPDMYKELYATPGEKGFGSVIKTLITNPFFVIYKLITKEKLLYLMHLFVPLAFLPARRWWLWIGFVPGFLTSLLGTNYKPLTMYSFQYVMHWTPYLFLGVVLLLDHLRRTTKQGRARAIAAASALAFATVATTYNAGAFPRRDTLKAGYRSADFTISPEEHTRYEQLQQLIALIPPDASVAATERVGTHVSSRIRFHSMRRGTWNAEYLLASERELTLDKTRMHLGNAAKSGSYGVLKRLGDMAVLKRGHSTAGNEQFIADWKL